MSRRYGRRTTKPSVPAAPPVLAHVNGSVVFGPTSTWAGVWTIGGGTYVVGDIQLNAATARNGGNGNGNG